MSGTIGGAAKGSITEKFTLKRGLAKIENL